MDATQFALAILGSSVLSALISQIGAFVLKKEDHKENKFEAIEKDINNIHKAVSSLSEGMRLLLLDRMRYVGQSYIKQGCVDFDDRRLLKQMHKVYHTGLGGNGDLDTLMEEVDGLPLRIKE